MEKEPVIPELVEGLVEQYMTPQTSNFLCSICLNVVNIPVQCVFFLFFIL